MEACAQLNTCTYIGKSVQSDTNEMNLKSGDNLEVEQSSDNNARSRSSSLVEETNLLQTNDLSRKCRRRSVSLCVSQLPCNLDNRKQIYHSQVNDLFQGPHTLLRKSVSEPGGDSVDVESRKIHYKALNRKLSRSSPSVSIRYSQKKLIRRKNSLFATSLKKLQRFAQSHRRSSKSEHRARSATVKEIRPSPGQPPYRSARRRSVAAPCSELVSNVIRHSLVGASCLLLDGCGRRR